MYDIRSFTRSSTGSDAFLYFASAGTDVRFFLELTHENVNTILQIIVITIHGDTLFIDFSFGLKLLFYIVKKIPGSALQCKHANVSWKFPC